MKENEKEKRQHKARKKRSSPLDFSLTTKLTQSLIAKFL